MNRRGFLGGVGATGAIGLAGCLEALGFEEQSAWRDPPLVDDRPDAVYLPASTESMGIYGTAVDETGDYAVALSYTFPHRFWTVADQDRNRVVVEAEDTLHLMCTVWDPETDTTLPVNLDIDLWEEDADGDGAGGPEPVNPWPMLSQRMGFHYGDNVQLAGEGAYTAEISVGPATARRTGDFEGRFEDSSILEIDFEYARSDIHDLEFELIDHDRRGSRDALELMGDDDDGHDHDHDHDHDDGHDSHTGDEDSDSHDDHGDGQDGDENDHDSHEDHDDHENHQDHGNDHPPSSRGPHIDDLEGRHLGTESSADATISVVKTDLERFTGDDDTYLAVFTRTPHNDVILPLMTLSATVDRGENASDESSPVVDERLTETLDHEYGHHYGLAIDELDSGDQVTISVDSHPQIARHDGYETAFFDFEDVRFTV